jgi:hypothetical protein
MNATQLFVIDFDSLGNYKVSDVEGKTMAQYEGTMRFSLRRQQVQGRFDSLDSAIKQAAKLARQYATVEG